MKKRLVFLDTMGLVALVHRGDRWHQQAVQIYNELIGERKVTTDAVLIEVGNVLREVRLRHLALTLKERIEAGETRGIIEIVHTDEALIERAWQLYRQRLDKVYSMVDCLSFVVMHDRSISDAFTYDRHFEQEGFRRLIK